MTAESDPYSPLRQRVSDLLAENLLGPVGAASISPPPGSGTAQPEDRAFQVALGPIERMKVRGALALGGADRRLDAAIGAITAGRFGPDQVHALEDRALANARPEDEHPPMGLQDGSPIVLDPQQKAIIDRLIGQMGPDPLGRAAKAAYQRAWTNGQITLRSR